LKGYASENITRVIKSRRMRWVGNVERTDEVGNAYDLLSENLKEETDRKT